jgi:VanZ family protein
MKRASCSNRSARPTIDKRRQRATNAARLAWAAWCALIVYGSLGTWAFHRPGIWAPTLVVPSDVAENIVLYVPFGVFGFLALRGGYRRHWMRLVARIALLALLFSASNEAFQLYTIDRVASLTDIASAAVGALAGGALIALWRAPQ